MCCVCACRSLFKQITALPGQQVIWDIKTYSTGIVVDTSATKTYGPVPDSDWHGVVLGQNGRPAIGASVMILRQYGGGAALTTDTQGRF